MPNGLLLGNGYGAGHVRVNRTNVGETACGIKCKAVALALGQEFAFRAVFAVIFGDVMLCAVLVGPGYGRAFFDGDAIWAKRKVLNSNRIGRRRRGGGRARGAGTLAGSLFGRIHLAHRGVGFSSFIIIVVLDQRITAAREH